MLGEEGARGLDERGPGGRFPTAPCATASRAPSTSGHRPAVRDDVARFARAVEPRDLLATSHRLGGFGGPALLVWGTADRFFKLCDVFARARLVEIEGGRTFVPHDHRARLAKEIAAFSTPQT